MLRIKLTSVIIMVCLHLPTSTIHPARGVSEIRDGEDLWQWSRLEIRLGLSSVNHTTKTIHHQFRSPNDAWKDYLNTWGIEPPAARVNVLMHIELWPTAIKLNLL